MLKNKLEMMDTSENLNYLKLGVQKKCDPQKKCYQNRTFAIYNTIIYGVILRELLVAH